MVDQKINHLFAQAVTSLGASIPVIEIGAGTGSLTAHLLNVAPVVHAVERDRDLIPLLKEQFAEHLSSGHLVLHEADGARFDIASIFDHNRRGILVGNLPYHLTSSIILLALRNAPSLVGAIFLVQKEVADRLVAEPNCKQYGFLTAVLKLGFKLRKIANVDRSAFWPQPRVDSAIIQMTTADHGISKIDDLDRFIVFVREIFQKRRKKLSTILADKIDKATFAKLGIDPNLRPENLPPEAFATLFLFAKSQA